MHSKKSQKSLTPQVRHVLRVILATYVIIWCVVVFTLHNAINRYDAESYIYIGIFEKLLTMCSRSLVKPINI